MINSELKLFPAFEIAYNHPASKTPRYTYFEYIKNLTCEEILYAREGTCYLEYLNDIDLFQRTKRVILT